MAGPGVGPQDAKTQDAVNGLVKGSGTRTLVQGPGTRTIAPRHNRDAHRVNGPGTRTWYKGRYKEGKRSRVLGGRLCITPATAIYVSLPYTYMYIYIYIYMYIIVCIYIYIHI